MPRRRHVFISHHHADDSHVSGLTGMLSRRGYEIRNSSIRAKPENQRRLDEKRVSDATIRRLLRMKMSWASTVVVLIGKKTHERPWVDWEIRKAHELGKRIVGVFERGGTANDVPPAFEDYGDALVAWNSDNVIGAIEGDCDPFEQPDGTPRTTGTAGPRRGCAA
ncbi:TIR domain-containing protein [Sphingomonas aurantiaca]|uniref:TIR domain-containing protein n=1 Tax=Sphingomonas aurantiaca TaxID=185949 RepID=UPI003354BBC0